MPLTIKIEAGNFEQALVDFFVTADQDSSSLTFKMGLAVHEMPFDQWPELIKQIREERSNYLKRDCDPPLGEKSFRRITKQLLSTPAYQQFLAGIDIAKHLDIVEEDNTEFIVSHAALLQGRRASHLSGRGSLIFIPESWQDIDALEIDELIANHKLCRFAVENETDKYRGLYVPYQTSNVKISDRAKTILLGIIERIR